MLYLLISEKSSLKLKKSIISSYSSSIDSSFIISVFNIIIIKL